MPVGKQFFLFYECRGDKDGVARLFDRMDSFGIRCKPESHFFRTLSHPGRGGISLAKFHILRNWQSNRTQSAIAQRSLPRKTDRQPMPAGTVKEFGDPSAEHAIWREPSGSSCNVRLRKPYVERNSFRLPEKGSATE